jgi:hypothetical protein
MVVSFRFSAHPGILKAMHGGFAVRSIVVHMSVEERNNADV